MKNINENDSTLDELSDDDQPEIVTRSESPARDYQQILRGVRPKVAYFVDSDSEDHLDIELDEFTYRQHRSPTPLEYDDFEIIDDPNPRRRQFDDENPIAPPPAFRRTSNPREGQTCDGCRIDGTRCGRAVDIRRAHTLDGYDASDVAIDQRVNDFNDTGAASRVYYYCDRHRGIKLREGRFAEKRGDKRTRTVVEVPVPLDYNMLCHPELTPRFRKGLRIMMKKPFGPRDDETARLFAFWSVHNLDDDYIVLKLGTCSGDIKDAASDFEACGHRHPHDADDDRDLGILRGARQAKWMIGYMLEDLMIRTNYRGFEFIKAEMCIYHDRRHKDLYAFKAADSDEIMAQVDEIIDKVVKWVKMITGEF